jgi:hypothetical protein
MPFVQVVKMKPAYQKQNEHENLGPHLRLPAIKLLASLA